VLLVILTFPSLVVAIEETAESLLSKVVSNFQIQSYEASALYIRPSGMESINIKREGELEHITFNDNGEHARLISVLNDKEVYQTAHGLSVHHNKVYFNSLRYLNEHLAKSLESYDLFISKNYDQVAGIQTARLSVISKNNDRYSYIYWVDVRNYIILRVDTLNETGELIERMVFTSLTLNHAAERTLPQAVNVENTQASHYYHKNNSKTGQVTLQWLPSNFTVSSMQSVYDDKGALFYKLILLTDGFAKIGIYLGHHWHEAKLTRGQQLDAFHVFKPIANKRIISVEGQLPYEILEKVGLNIIFGNNDD